jgi:dihydropteroate synthase
MAAMWDNDAPLVMGVLNVTPDSFSDGGRFLAKDAALSHAEKLVSEGADIVDVGGESTRPNAPPVSLQEELDRVLPVVEAIAGEFPVRISIDSSKVAVAEAAVRAGATIINDVTAGRDPEMARLGAEHDVRFILMHMRGNDPRTMQNSPEYPRGVVSEVRFYLADRVRAFAEAGIEPERIWIDPGIGFGKTPDHNLELLRGLDSFAGVAGRVVVGTSRKSFLAHILGSVGAPMEQREAGTLASNLFAYTRGASVFRVHDVGAMKRALKTWEAIAFGSL